MRQKNTEWWNREIGIPFSSDSFTTIIEFFLFNCPVEYSNGTKVCVRAKTFRDYGYDSGALNSLLANMKKGNGYPIIYNPIGSTERVEDVYYKIFDNTNYSDPNIEFLIFRHTDDLGKTKSIFYAIRNAFAHGSFSVVFQNNRTYYLLENCHNGTIKARMRLREETLLKWIDLVKEPKVYLKRKSKKNLI